MAGFLSRGKIFFSQVFKGLVGWYSRIRIFSIFSRGAGSHFAGHFPFSIDFQFSHFQNLKFLRNFSPEQVCNLLRNVSLTTQRLNIKKTVMEQVQTCSGKKSEVQRSKGRSYLYFCHINLFRLPDFGLQICNFYKKAALVGIVLVLLTGIFLSFTSLQQVLAANGINKTINFQGKLVDKDGLNVANTSYSVQFKVYDTEEGSTVLWQETDSVTTQDGIFRVALGANSPFPEWIFTTDNLWLSINVNSDGEMNQRIRFAAVPYAMNAASLNGVVATQSATGFTLQGGSSNQKTLTLNDNVTFNNASLQMANGRTITTSDADITLGSTIKPTSAGGLTINANGANGLTLDTSANGAGAIISIGNTNANSLVFGNVGYNPNFTFNGTGAFTVNGGGNNNITLGSNGGTGNVVIQPNGGGQAGLIINKQGSNDIFTASASGNTKLVLSNNGSLGLGTVNPSGTLDVRGNSATTPVASIGGNTNSASLIVDNSGNGDILTASASGNPRFVIKNNGTLVAGSDVSNATILPNTAAHFTANIDSYAQINFQNKSNGNNASTDFVATANNGSDTTNYIDFGINSSTYNNASYNIGGANDGYLYNNGGNLTIGTQTSGKALIFHTSGTTSSNERMRIDPNGNIGVGTTTPIATLDVRGLSNYTAIASFSGSVNNAGLVVDNHVGDLFAASSSGQSRFTVTQNGVITLANGETIDNASTDNTIILTSNAANGAGVLRVPVETGTTNDPSLNSGGNIYYNATLNKFRCYQGTGWQDCIPAVNFQSTQETSLTKPVTLSGTEQDLISGTITPSSATGKIWINATAAIIGDNSTGRNVTIRIRRTACTTGTQVGVDQVISTPGNGSSYTVAVNYVDTPGAGATTFYVCAFTSGGSPTVGGRGMTLYEPTGSAASTGLGSLTVRETDTSPSVVGVSALEFGPTTTSSDEFIVTDQTGGVARIRLGNQVALLNAAKTVTGGWTFNTAATTFSTALNADGGIATSATDQNLAFTPNGAGNAVFNTDYNTGLYIGSASNAPALLSVTGGIGSNAGFILNRDGSTGDIMAASSSGSTKFVLKNNGSLGMGTSNPQATFDLRGNIATLPAASFSASTNFATMVVDNSGNGDLFTASKSGAPKFVITNSGNLQVSNGVSLVPGVSVAGPSCVTSVNGIVTGSASCGFGNTSWYTANGTTYNANSTLDFLIGGQATTSAKFAVLNMNINTPAASVAALNTPGNAFSIDALGNIQTWDNTSLSVGGGNTGNIYINPTAYSRVGIGFNGAPLAGVDIRGISGTLSVASISGKTSVAGLVVDNSGTGDLFTASQAGMTRFVIGNNGTFQTNGAVATVGYNRIGSSTSSYGLTTANDLYISGKLDVAGSLYAPLTGQSGYWLRNGNAISPAMAQDDMLLGSTATASAKFAVTNIATGTPTASISSYTTPNALSLDAYGNIQTFAKTALSLGGATTGNIYLSPTGASRIGIGFNGAPLAGIDVRGILGTIPAASISGNTATAGVIIDNSGSGDIFTASSSGRSRFTVASNGNILVGAPGAATGQFVMNNSANTNAVTLASGATSASYTLTLPTAKGNQDECLKAADANGTLTFGSCATMTQYWALVNSDTLNPATNTQKLGVGNMGGASALGTLEVRAVSGTLPVATISGNTSFAGLVIDNTGSGDIFTASSSGMSRLTVANDGRIILGAKQAAGGQLVFYNAANTYSVTLAGSTPTSNSFTLTLPATVGNDGDCMKQTGTTGALIFGPCAGGNLWVMNNNTVTLTTQTQQLGIGPVGTNTGLATLAVRAVSASLPTASISGATNQAGMVVDNSGNGDVLTASTSGLTRFVVTRNGVVQAATYDTLPTQNLTIGSSMTSNSITLGAAGQTGTITLGQSTDTHTLNIDAATIADTKTATINIGTNATGSGKDVITIGNGNGASSLSLQAGSGGLSIGTAATAKTITIGTTGAVADNIYLLNTTTAGTISLGQGNAAHTIAIGNVQNGGSVSVGGAMTTGTVAIGGGSQTGTITLGQSNQTNIINIGNVALAATKVQTINIGATASGTSGYQTITIGAYSGGAGTGNSTVAIYAGGGGVSHGPSVTLGTTSTSAVCSSIANGTTPTAGTAYELIDCNNNPAKDYAEFYPAALGAEYGDIMVTSTELVEEYTDDGKGNILHDAPKRKVVKLVKSTQAYASSVIGVVSNNYSDFSSTGYDSIDPKDNPMPIALNGRIPVKIASSSRTILPGDYLTTSNESGRAMKALHAGQVIGKALESWDPASGKDQVLMFVEQGYFNGFSSTEGLAGLDGSSLETTSFIGQSTPVSLLKMEGNRIVLQKDDNTMIDALTFDKDGNASFSGTLTAKKIKAEQIEGLDFKDVLATMAAEFAQNSSVKPSEGASVPFLDVDGLATISGAMRVKQNALIEGILNVVDTITTNNLIVNAISDFFGKATFHSEVTFEDHPTFNKDTAGFAIVKKGHEGVSVVFDKEYKETPVINVSMVFNPDAGLPSEEVASIYKSITNSQYTFLVVNPKTTGFSILLNKPAEDDIKFSWTALAVDNPSIFTSPLRFLDVLNNSKQQIMPTPISDVTLPPVKATPTIQISDMPLSPTPVGESP